MKHEWMKSWRPASLALAGLMGVTMARAGRPARRPERHNETTLAGMRPGGSKLSPTASFAGFGDPVREATSYIWADLCDGRILSVEMDKARTVQTIAVSSLGQRHEVPGCGHRDELALRAALATGRGLKLGDACARVRELYGNPESRSPSVRGTEKLTLLFYSFDWAGDNVPQSMEVSCTRKTGQVVEITLAAASL